jgi:ornithine cyclodeaminase
MKIIHRAEIGSALSKDAVIDAVRDAFVAHSRGQIESAVPMHMTYRDGAGNRTGDCHVKAAHSNQHPVIAIKTAIGFYKNPERGLPVNNGLVLLLSRQTGEPVALLLDEGLLTTFRTAAAGAIAASLATVEPDDGIGIVGTGDQAYHQADWTTHYLGLKNVTVFGRSTDKANALVERLQENGLNARRADSVADLCAVSRIVITTTPASEPVVLSSDLGEVNSGPIHFVAMGADTYGKQELDTDIFARASTIIVDDKDQCIDHGDLAAAHRERVIDPDQLVSIGSALANDMKIADDVSVVDLTGLGAQDLAIASLVIRDGALALDL